MDPGTTGLKQLHESTIIISINYKNELYCLKNRTGKYGEITLEEAKELMMDMLCKKIYDGRLDMFQDGLKRELIKAINKVIDEEVPPKK